MFSLEQLCTKELAASSPSRYWQLQQAQHTPQPKTDSS
jgi:hypothetical protein